MKITLQARPIRCAFCHDEAYGALGRCALCGTLAHQDCFASLGKCPTLGCRGRLPLPPPQRRRSADERVLDLLEWVTQTLRSTTDHHWACLLLGMLLGCGLTLIYYTPSCEHEVAPSPPASSLTAERLRTSAWDFRRKRGRLPQDLSEAIERGAPPPGYTLARTRERMFLVWRDFEARGLRAMEVAPLDSALASAAPVASGD